MQLVGLLLGDLDVVVEHLQHLLVGADLLGQKPILLGEVEVIADLGQDIGEVAARQERVEDRRPIGVVRLADA